MFQLLTEVHPPYCPSTTIYNWVSTRTGLQLVLIKRQTPAVNGYFAVATEITNDSGCPHTLEHLVFMGSEKYPYKGLLDTVGNQQLSNTNAWTGQDQTVYSLSTAGWQGFSTLLPVYLDHVLHAQLDDSACMTEVYHIDGDGQEKGVVFSEMQGVENTSISLVTEASQRTLFKEGSGYFYNTGGAMKALRVLKNETIREYHEKLYTPDNLSVIITGDVEPNDLLEIMESFDDSLKEPKNIPRPFIDSPKDDPLDKTIVKEITFPDKDESYGEALISWIGPDALDLNGNTALQVIGSYFTTQSIGKIQLELLNVDDPLGTEVSTYEDDYMKSVFNLSLSGIPTEKLEKVDEEIMRVIKKNSTADAIDMSLIRDSIERKRDKFVLSADTDPTIFAYIAIDAFLYGKKDGSTLKEWTQNLDEYEALKEWSSEQWAEFISTYLVNNHHVTILGRPSAQNYRDLKQAKSARLEEIKKNYDLKELGEQLEAAKALNDTPIPASVLNSFPTPDVERIKLITTSSASTSPLPGLPLNTELQRFIESDIPKDFGLNVHFEAYNSEFVTVKLFMSSEAIDQAYLPYIDTLLSESFSMPMKLDDGTVLSHEEVGAEIKRDTLVSSISTNGMLQELVMIDIRTKLKDYEKAIKWIQRAFFNVVFDKQRLQIFINKHLSNLAEDKRDGSSVLAASIYENTLIDSSLRRQSESLVTEEFFKNLQDDMDKVQADLYKLVEQLYRPENVRLLIYGGIESLKSPVSSWNEFYERLNKRRASDQLMSVPKSWDKRTELGKDPKNQAILTVVPPTESSYVSVITKAPIDFFHEDLPAITVLNVYLGVAEGPLWKEVRGAGHAYGARIYQKSDMGHLICNFYRASDPVKAYEATKKMIMDLASGATAFEDNLVQGAILSLAGALALDQSTQSTAVIVKYFDGVLRERGPDFVKHLISLTRGVTKEQLRHAIQKYLVPLFEAPTSAVFAVCHPSAVNSLDKFFAEQGYEVTRKTLDIEDVGSDDEDEEFDSEDGDSESETEESESE